jgi:hypothetical protein
VVGELAQWYSQHSLIGVGSGFSDELYSAELYGECWQYWWCVNQTRTSRLALIRGISDGTPVSGSDDKTSERQQPDPQTHFRVLKNGAGRERLLMPTGAAFIQGKGPAGPLHLIVLGPLTPRTHKSVRPPLIKEVLPTRFRGSEMVLPFDQGHSTHPPHRALFTLGDWCKTRKFALRGSGPCGVQNPKTLLFGGDPLS